MKTLTKRVHSVCTVGIAVPAKIMSIVLPLCNVELFFSGNGQPFLLFLSQSS